MDFTVSYIAVIGAAIAGAVINAAWYSGLFAKQVTALRAADPTIAGRAPAPPLYSVALAAQLIMAFTLAVFLKTLGFTGWSNGLMVGFFAWLGFTATALAVVGMHVKDRHRAMARKVLRLPEPVKDRP